MILHMKEAFSFACYTNVVFQSNAMSSSAPNNHLNVIILAKPVTINRYNFKLDLCSFKVFSSGNTATLYEIQYLDFTKIKNQSFTSKISINETFFSQNSTNLEKEGSLINQINIEFKSINLNNKFKLPFKIPNNYTKILINVK